MTENAQRFPNPWRPPPGLARPAEDALREVAAELARPTEFEADLVANDSRAVFASGRVIRDDDLRLLELMGEAAKVAGGTGFFALLATTTGAATIGAAVGVFVAIARLLRAFYRKSAVVDPLQCHILLALRASKAGLTLPELTAALNVGTADANMALTGPEVASSLDELKQVRLGDGTFAVLAQKGLFERWSACGV
jgi:hypothetical protein